MAKHRLQGEWWEPDSGVRCFAATGEFMRVNEWEDELTVGRKLNVGEHWEVGE